MIKRTEHHLTQRRAMRNVANFTQMVPPGGTSTIFHSMRVAGSRSAAGPASPMVRHGMTENEAFEGRRPGTPIGNPERGQISSS